MFVRTIKAVPAAFGAFAITAGGAAAAGLTSTPIHADYDSTAAKKTIYDQQPAASADAQPKANELADAVPRVVAYAREAREQGAEIARMVGRHGQMAVGRWIATEKRIESVVRRTVPRGESLAPGIVYVGVAALAGPIFTRRRSFAIRWASPLLFASAAAACFLPGTAAVVARNVWGRYGDPAAIDRIGAQWDALRLAERDLRARVAGAVQELRMSLQEGRPFSPPDKQQPSTRAGALTQQVESEVRGAVERTEEFVASLASAAAENIRSDVSGAQRTTYDNVLELPDGVSHDEKLRKSEKQLPLGFKHKAD
ncbi:hypothetical protein IWW48_006001 [Coemansia sp. RSA 1200]|nr:hypothetical protein IWW48_006001 [Coemansia sp. RSA 1200]